MGDGYRNRGNWYGKGGIGFWRPKWRTSVEARKQSMKET